MRNMRNNNDTKNRFVFSSLCYLYAGNLSQSNQPPRSTQPGHPSVGRCNEYRPKGGDALRLGVKADMVWFAGNTV